MTIIGPAGEPNYGLSHTTCDSKHLIAEAATLFDFWIASETELSAQSHLLVDAQALTRLRTGF
jgi:hypothetical protein